jgi:hypothetical protein
MSRRPRPRECRVEGDHTEPRKRVGGRPTLGALTRDLRVEGSEGKHEDRGHALEEKLPRDVGARHVRYAAS